MTARPPKPNVELGEFPFPLTVGEEESRYLTWIRNHCNYMAVGGLRDYARAIGVLVRGVVINLLVVIPYLLVVAFALATYEITFRDEISSVLGRSGITVHLAGQYQLTLLCLSLAAIWVLIFPLLTPAYRMWRHKLSVERGSDSSVKQRDRYERTFGVVLIAIVAVAVFETMPAMRVQFRDFVYEGNRWGQLLPVLGAAMVTMAASDKLLSVLSGALRKLAAFFIAVLGLFVPIVIVLFVSDFILQQGSLWPDWYERSHLIWLGTIGLLAFSWFVMSLGARSKFKGGPRETMTERLKRWGTTAVSMAVPFVTITVVVGFAAGGSKRLQRELDVAADRFVEHEADLESLSRFITSPLVLDNPLAGNLHAIHRKSRVNSDLYSLYENFTHAFDHFESIRQVAINDTGLPQDAVRAELNRLSSRFGTINYTIFSTLEPNDLVKAIVNIRDSVVDAFIGPTWDELAYSDWLVLDDVFYVDEFIEFETFIFNRQNYPTLSRIEEFGELDREVRSLARRVQSIRREVAAIGAFAPDGIYPALAMAATDARREVQWLKGTFVLALGVFIWVFCWLFVDVNLTSVHGLYRDRLASAFLVGEDTRGDVDIEEDLDLAEICRHEAGSIAPYHLINAAINLQGSADIGIRDRKSDFFVFSKRFIGGQRTGYCRSETMEQVFPEMGLSTAMAISAAAASPNMGRSTNPALVFLMAFLNIRLGFWVPNPGVLRETLRRTLRQKRRDGLPLGIQFQEVFDTELEEIERRWEHLPDQPKREVRSLRPAEPSVSHRLVGVAFSGGGIRSATINLGIAQALDLHGAFRHIDYMSTVSGGGYLGSSISALMRRRVRTTSEIKGQVTVSETPNKKVVVVLPGEKSTLWNNVRSFVRDRIVRRVVPIGTAARRARMARAAGVEETITRTVDVGPIRRTTMGSLAFKRVYRYAGYADVSVKSNDWVRRGQRLVNTRELKDTAKRSFGDRFRWRVRPGAFLREMLGRLDEKHQWVNVSDGGHIENLATIELLRRRCKFIIIGDGEADPNHFFNGVANLIRLARIDLGVEIKIELDHLRLNKDRRCKEHWALGQIKYPNETACGYLLYLKSSISGDEDEVIKEYGHRHETFPHESTADQFFDEGQFEAYRSLGQHIAEQALEHAKGKLERVVPSEELESGVSPPRVTTRKKTMTFAQFEEWFQELARLQKAREVDDEPVDQKSSARDPADKNVPLATEVP